MFSKHHDQARKRYGGKLIVVHCPPEMREAVDQAAEQEMCRIDVVLREPPGGRGEA
jgi:hypothetical protein